MVDLACPRHVGNVNHTVDTFFKFDECTVSSEVTYLTTDTSTDWVIMASHIPWVSVELTSTEGDLLLFLLHTENNRLDFFTDAKYFVWLGNALCP